MGGESKVGWLVEFILELQFAIHFTLNFTANVKPASEDLIKIRSLILTFVRKLVLKDLNSPDVQMSNKDDELQGILNYLSTMQEVFTH